MNYGCHRKLRAELFRKSNYVSHISKRRLNKGEVGRYIQQLESYFDRLDEEKQKRGYSGGSRGTIVLKEGHGELQVEISGNKQSGSLVVQKGLGEYAEIHFSPRAIHVYRSERDHGSFDKESAFYISKLAPASSFRYGSATCPVNTP